MIETIDSILGPHLDELLLCSAHGRTHAKTVMKHVDEALKYEHSTDIDYLMLISAYLHDVDDRKFCNTVDYANARQLLLLLDLSEVEKGIIIDTIKLVSASINGDFIPTEVPNVRQKDIKKLMIVRYADRLETGIDRAYLYNRYTSKAPLYLPSTPHTKDSEEMYGISRPRFVEYMAGKRKSETMIDHFYDKLLMLRSFPISNPYLEKVCEENHSKLIVFLQWFYERRCLGEVSYDDVEEYISL